MNLNDMIDGIALAEPSKQEELLKLLAGFHVGGAAVGLDDLKKLFAERKETAQKRAESAAKRIEREKLNAVLVAKQSEADKFAIAADGLADFVASVEAAKGEVGLTVKDGKVAVTVLGIVATPAKGGNNGGGRPKKDEPQPYVDSNGDRVTGPLTDWARNNLSEVDLENAPKVGGKLASGARLVKYLKDNKFITDSPVPTAAADTTNASAVD